MLITSHTDPDLIPELLQAVLSSFFKHEAGCAAGEFHRLSRSVVMKRGALLYFGNGFIGVDGAEACVASGHLMFGLPSGWRDR